MLEMPPADTLRTTARSARHLRRLARSSSTTAKDWVSPSTRVIFTLDYAGLGERRRCSTAGMERVDRATAARSDRGVPAAKPGTLSPLQDCGRSSSMRISCKRTSARPAFAIVDGRAAGVLRRRRRPAASHGQRAQDRAHRRRARAFRSRRSSTTDLLLKSADGAGGAVREGRRQAGRHGHRLLPHRPAGDGDAVRRAHARPPGAAVRRIVRGLVAPHATIPVENPSAKASRDDCAAAPRRTPIRTWPASGSASCCSRRSCSSGRGLGASGAFASGAAGVVAAVAPARAAGESVLRALPVAAAARGATGCCSRSPASSSADFSPRWLAGRLRRGDRARAATSARDRGWRSRSPAAR